MFDISVKRCPFPILWARHITVFDWVEVDVIQMVLVILFVAYAMLPKTLLPKGWLMMALLTKYLCKPTLNNAPATREVSVTIFYAPNAMNVIRQQDPTRNSKWIPVLAFHNGFSKA